MLILRPSSSTNADAFFACPMCSHHKIHLRVYSVLRLSDEMRKANAPSNFPICTCSIIC